MHLTVHKILYWYWSEIATVIVLSPPTWIFLGIFCFVFLKFVFCSCFAWKVIRSDVSCTTHFNILDKFSYIFIPVDGLLIWSMGRYLTSGMNILPTSNPRVILSVLGHPDFSLVAFLYIYKYIYLFIYIFFIFINKYFQPHVLIPFFSLVVRPLQCTQMSWLRTLSQCVASCEFISTVVCWCAVSYNCHFHISHLKCSSEKLAVNWLPVLLQFFSITSPNLMLLFLQGGRTIFLSWFIMHMMNSYI